MRVCIACHNFYFRTGQPNYSDVTPGYGAEMGCYKNHWQFDMEDDGQEKYREVLLTAENCQDFDKIDLSQYTLDKSPKIG